MIIVQVAEPKFEHRYGFLVPMCLPYNYMYMHAYLTMLEIIIMWNQKIEKHFYINRCYSLNMKLIQLPYYMTFLQQLKSMKISSDNLKQHRFNEKLGTCQNLDKVSDYMDVNLIFLTFLKVWKTTGQ